jgi:hypothetical protein
LAIAFGVALSACAGRDPAPIATVQVQDAYPAPGPPRQ